MAGKRRKKADSKSRGLEAREAAEGAPPPAAAALRDAIREDGGAALRALPRSARRALAAPRRAADREGRADAVPARPLGDARQAPHRRASTRSAASSIRSSPCAAEDGRYWTPNGNHRLAALRSLGARAIVALVLPEPEVAYKILALNTEKAHNLREKSLEVIRMARDLAGRGDRRREGLRPRVRGGRVPDARRLLREERALRRRRLPSGPEARRRVPRRAARRRRSRSEARAGRRAARARRGRRGRDEGAQGARASRARTCGPSSSRASTPSASSAARKPTSTRRSRRCSASAKKFKAGVRQARAARPGRAAPRRSDHAPRFSPSPPSWPCAATSARGRREAARPRDGEGRRPDPSLRREDDLLADLALGLRAQVAGGREDAGRLVLPVQHLLHARARRNAPRRPEPLRQGRRGGRPDPRPAPDRAGRRDRHPGGRRKGPRLPPAARRRESLGKGARRRPRRRDRPPSDGLERAVAGPQGLPRRRHAGRRLEAALSVLRRGGRAVSRGASARSERSASTPPPSTTARRKTSSFT